MSRDNLNFYDLYTEVQEKVGDTDATVLGYIKKYIDDRNNDVNGREAWLYLLVPDSLTFTIGPGMYRDDLPNKFKEEVVVYDTTADKYLVKKEYKWIIKQDPDMSETTTNSQGFDYYYYPEAGKIAFYPPLDEDEDDNTSVKFDYIADETLENDADTPKMPNRFRVKILVNGACADYWEWKDEDSRAAKAEAKFEKGIAEMAMDQGIYTDVGDEVITLGWDDQNGEINQD